MEDNRKQRAYCLLNTILHHSELLIRFKLEIGNPWFVIRRSNFKYR